MGKKLLVADDSTTIQKVIKFALSSGDYDILTVSEGKDAIRAIEQERPDVVLIDLALPGENASSVKRKIQQRPELASIKFVLMASSIERLNEMVASDIRFDERLIKPFDPAYLRKIIAQLMEGGATPPPPTEAFQTPMKPQDLPPVAPHYETISETPQASPVTPEEFEMVTPQLPTPEDETAKIRTLESDIKNLTESTIKISDVEELHWKLDDKKKMKMASIPLTQEPPSTFDLETIAPIKSVDDGGSSFLKSKQNILRSIKPAPEVAHTDVTRADVEKIVRQDLEVMIEKLARQVITEVTEKVVRKEIEKILAEP